MRVVIWVAAIALALVGCGSTRRGDSGQKQRVTHDHNVWARKGSTAFPAGCGPEDVYRYVTDFLDAFNDGNQERLNRFFGDRFKWFSVTTDEKTHVAKYKTEHLPQYFAERHQHGETWKLQKLEVANAGWEPGVGIVFSIRRTADDLASGVLDSGGKGNIDCDSKIIVVWSMAFNPALTPPHLK